MEAKRSVSQWKVAFFGSLLSTPFNAPTETTVYPLGTVALTRTGDRKSSSPVAGYQRDSERKYVPSVEISPSPLFTSAPPLRLYRTVTVASRPGSSGLDGVTESRSLTCVKG